MTKNQTEIELDGKKIAISKKERRLARISQSLMEFVPLFAMFLIINQPERIQMENVGLVMSFLIVTVFVCAVFVVVCILAYLVWYIGMRKEL